MYDSMCLKESFKISEKTAQMHAIKVADSVLPEINTSCSAIRVSTNLIGQIHTTNEIGRTLPVASNWLS